MDCTIINICFCLTGLMLFSYWFYYVIGSPLADNINNADVGAIGFFLPYELAWRRLKSVSLDNQDSLGYSMMEMHATETNLTSDPIRRHQLHQDYLRNILATGRQLFTWERSILCPVCLHWWLTVIFVAVCLLFDFFHVREHYALAAFTYLVNHLIIRKI